MATVLIADPIGLAQTALLRGLGRRGDVCDVVSFHGGRRARFNSRFHRRVISVPDSAEYPEAFADAVFELCRTGAYDAVVPASDSSVEALLLDAERLSRHTGLLLPSPSQFSLGMDKVRTIEMCRDLGVMHPRSVMLGEDSDLDAIGAALGYPLVIKHRKNFGGSVGVRIVARPEDLASRVGELQRLATDPTDLIAQRFLPGALFDACAVARSGELAGMVTQVRRLMYPVSGGVGAMLATVDHPVLREQAASLIEKLEWTGPVQLEFKWDAESEAFSLIEINPRFWGTTGAWLKAGVNFPGLAVDLAVGREPLPLPELPPDLGFKYMVGRFPFAMIQLWRAKGVGALRDPASYSRSWLDFDLADPLPDLWRLYRECGAALRDRSVLVDRSLPAELISAFGQSATAAARSGSSEGEPGR